MLVTMVRTTLLRDLAAMGRGVEVYPDDASLWEPCGGMPNVGGTLVLHCAGNLRYFIGTMLGNTGYIRDREAEFARRDVPRAELMIALDATIDAVARTLARQPDDEHALNAPFPQPFGGRTLSVGTFLIHLTAHLAYHLGQLDYHRRAVTGSRASINAMSLAELPTAAAASAKRE